MNDKIFQFHDTVFISNPKCSFYGKTGTIIVECSDPHFDFWIWIDGYYVKVTKEDIKLIYSPITTIQKGKP